MLGQVWKVSCAAVRWIWRFSTLVVFVLMFGWIIASQTIGAVAHVTSAAIKAVTGVSTVLQSTRDANKLVEETKVAALSRERIARREIASLEKENLELKKSRRIVFRGKQIGIKEATTGVVRRLQARTKRLAAAGATSSVAEGIPFYGIAMIVAATGYELKTSCDSMKELHELDVAINPATADEQGRDYVCGLEVPTQKEIWEKISSSPEMVWSVATKGLHDAGETVSNLQAPNFSGKWHSAVLWFGGWFN